MASGDGILVLARHGQSTDNELNLFSGWRDPELTARGIEEARDAGRRLKANGLVFDVAFTSLLSRSRRSLDLMIAESGQTDLPVVSSQALNERHYGDLSGLNKEEARAVFGSDQVYLWRKSYAAVPPGGESLAMTADRTLPFCRDEIDPRLARGQRVLVVAHGNSLRSIVKHLDGLSDDDVESVHIATSQLLVYRTDARGAVVDKFSLLPGVATPA